MQPGNHGRWAEARKIEKYCELLDNGYIFQPVAMDVQGSLGESSEIFISCLWNDLSFARRSTSWQLFEATDFIGSSDRQCGLCSRNCDRQGGFPNGRIFKASKILQAINCVKRVIIKRYWLVDNWNMKGLNLCATQRRTIYDNVVSYVPTLLEP